MTGPWLDQLVAARIEDLRHSADHKRQVNRLTPEESKTDHRTASEWMRSRLGFYLVNVGQRLLTGSTSHSPRRLMNSSIEAAHQQRSFRHANR